MDTNKIKRLTELAQKAQLPDQYGSRDEEAAELGRGVLDLLKEIKILQIELLRDESL